MKNRNNADVPRARVDKDAEISDMQKKWGVSADEINDAIAEVGFDRPKIEEYLVNHRWSEKRNSDFSLQKGDVHEDESY